MKYYCTHVNAIRVVQLIIIIRVLCTKIVQLSFLDKIVHNIMKVGYARVSSTTQDLELQKHALLKAGCEKIFSESNGMDLPNLQNEERMLIF